MEHLVIIGNGISGVTLARHVRKLSDKRITIISAESEFFFSRTALMYVFMGHLKFEHTQPYENDFWKNNKIELKKAFVNHINTNDKTLILDDDATIKYDKLVIASGSKSNLFNWKGQDFNGVFTLYNKQDLENIDSYSKKTKSAVVVGGGLIGIELVEMLLSRNIEVTFLVRENSFWNTVLTKNESEIINKHILEHHIKLKLDTNLDEIIADENGNVIAVRTDKGEIINCELVGLTAGVSPNIDFVKSSNIAVDRGVLVNRFLETNCKDVYAIGDCAQQHEPIGNRRTIEAVWYTGRMMGETLAQTICNKPIKYNPGHWFNSAKFLDIEYQTYGWVFAQPKENEEHFYWEHSSHKKAVTIVFNKQGKEFIGINTFGIRMRHDFFDNALTNNKSIYYIIQHLDEAIFDPEFFKDHSKQIKNQFNKQYSELKTTLI